MIFRKHHMVSAALTFLFIFVVAGTSFLAEDINAFRGFLTGVLIMMSALVVALIIYNAEQKQKAHIDKDVLSHVSFGPKSALEDIYKEVALVGFDSELSTFREDMREYVVTFGSDAIKALDEHIRQNNNDADMVFETLNALGVIRHEDTHNERYALILGKLMELHPSPRVRIGAVYALAELNDLRALPELQKFWLNEENVVVRTMTMNSIERLRKNSILEN